MLLVRRIAGVLLLAASMLLMVPGRAAAHGIDTEAADMSVLDFVSVGMEHMLLGWDHLMFVAGVLLVAAEVKLAAKLISLFVLGHSTTLIVATLAGWRVDPEVVDLVIAISVVFVAGVAVFFGRPKNFVWFGGVVAGFGLVHGLGLATRFQDIGVPEGGELLRVIAFNVGIEIGQLTAVMALVVIALLIESVVGAARQEAVVTIAAAMLLGGGIVAASLLIEPLTSGEDDLAADEEYDGATGTCTVEDRTETLPGVGDHAAKDFYAPSEATPLEDFGHSVGDGYIAFLYPVAADEDEVEELREYIASDDAGGILAGSAEQVGDRYVAITYAHQLTCDELDLPALEAYHADWFPSP